MYALFEKIILVYSMIVCIGIVLFPFTIEKERILWDNDSKEDEHEDKEYKWKKVLRNIILLSVAGICIVGVIWLNWNKKYSWILFPVVLLTFFQRLEETLDSMSIVRKTLRSRDDNSLSIKEQASIMVIALFVGMLGMYKIPVKCLQIIEGFQNEVISDVLLLVILILFVTVYYFLMGAMLLIPIKVMSRIGRVVVKSKLPQKMTVVAEKYRKWYQQIGNFEYISIRVLEWGIAKKPRQIFIIPALIFIIIIDVFLKIVFGILRIFFSIGEHVLNGLIRLFKLLIHLLQRFAEISDRRMFILIFRSALIFSLTSIVILNRYMPIIKKYEAGTAVLEFLASAIVIPLVLSWIVDYENKSKLNNKNE